MKTVVVGVSSGIAACKSLDLIKLLRREGLNVVVIMTKSATDLIPKSLFEKASGHKVYCDLFEKNFNYKTILQNRHVDHIDLADSASAVIIAPATANIIAKIAYGIADDFLTTMLLATRAPVLVCPSMNVHMWQNPVVVQNIETLRSRGFVVLDPEEGDLACGYRGKGRLPVVAEIKNEIMLLLKRSSQLAGRKIIVTAGGTTEKIDDVRFIANKASGKMGVAIAQECYLRGADVLLLRASASVSPRYQLPQKTFGSSEELFSLVKKYLKNYDYIFHTAAVSDFSLVKPFTGKISSKKELKLVLQPAEKIISHIKKINPGIQLIGFKATWGLSDLEMIEEAKKKRQESRADFIVVNDVKKADRGFAADYNEVIVVGDKLTKKIPWGLKREVALKIIDEIFAK